MGEQKTNFDVNIRPYSQAEKTASGILQFKEVLKKYSLEVVNFYLYEYDFNSSAHSPMRLIETSAINIYFLKYISKINLLDLRPSTIGVNNTNAELDNVMWVELKHNRSIQGWTDWDFDLLSGDKHYLLSSVELTKEQPISNKNMYFVVKFDKNMIAELGDHLNTVGDEITFFQTNFISLSSFESFALVKNASHIFILNDDLGNWKNLISIQINFNNNILFSNLQLKGDIDNLELGRSLINYDCLLTNEKFLMPLIIKPININNNIQIYIPWFFQQYATPKTLAQSFNVANGLSIFDFLKSSPHAQQKWVIELIYVMQEIINTSLLFLSNLKGVPETNPLWKYANKPADYINNLWIQYANKYDSFLKTQEIDYAKSVLKMLSNVVIGDLAIDNGGNSKLYKFVLPWYLTIKNQLLPVDDYKTLEVIAQLSSNWYELDSTPTQKEIFTPKKFNIGKSISMRDADQVVSFPIIPNPITEANFDINDTAQDQNGLALKYLIFIPFDDLNKLNQFLNTIGTYDYTIIESINYAEKKTTTDPNPYNYIPNPVPVPLTKQVITDNFLINKYVPQAKDILIYDDEYFRDHCFAMGDGCPGHLCFPTTQYDFCVGTDNHKYTLSRCQTEPGGQCAHGSENWIHWEYERNGKIFIIEKHAKSTNENVYIFTEREFYNFIYLFNSSNAIFTNDPLKQAISNINSLHINHLYGDEIDLIIKYINKNDEQKNFSIENIQLLNELDEKNTLTKIIF